MKKTDGQYLVDTFLFICMVGIAFIGFLMGLPLKSFSGRNLRTIEKKISFCHARSEGCGGLFDEEK